MGLLVLDRAPAAEDLLEDLDQDSLCSCDHGPASHSAEGCLECPCGALCLDLAGEGLESAGVEDEVVARVVAFLKAARARQKRLDTAPGSSRPGPDPLPPIQSAQVDEAQAAEGAGRAEGAPRRHDEGRHRPQPGDPPRSRPVAPAAGRRAAQLRGRRAHPLRGRRARSCPRWLARISWATTCTLSRSTTPFRTATALAAGADPVNSFRLSRQHPSSGSGSTARQMGANWQGARPHRDPWQLDCGLSTRYSCLRRDRTA